MEWPFNCRYWVHPEVKQLLGIAPIRWTRMKVRACAHGQLIQTGVHAGKALTKAWRVMSNVPNLSGYLELPCPGGHQHIATQGSFTLASGKYPNGMADAFHRCFRTATVDSCPLYRGIVIHEEMRLMDDADKRVHACAVARIRLRGPCERDCTATQEGEQLSERRDEQRW